MNKIYPRILIVEDEEKWRNLLIKCIFLNKLKPESIAWAETYEQAEMLLLKNKFDLAITDFLLEKDKAEYPWRYLGRKLQKYHIPVIVVSGYIDNIDLMTEMINDYDVRGVYHKGKIDLHKLGNHIERLIERKDNLSHISNDIKITKTPNISEDRKKVTILHLSDLHCGPNSCFYGDDKSPLDPVNFSQTIIDDIDDQNFSIDALVISGDFSSTSQNKEFDIALDFIDELKTKLNLSKNEIIVVPGNHDINWDEKDGNRRSQYQRFYRQFYGKKVIDPERLFHVASVKDKNIVIAGFDSCSIERPEYAGIGYIGHDQRKKIFNQINDITNGDKDYV